MGLVRWRNFDACFGAGLLEALTQVVVDHTRCVLLTCDTAYPEPLYSARPIPDSFGIGLVLAPQSSATSLAQISVSFTDARADTLDDCALENLRLSIPAARGLPLLCAIASKQNQRVVLDYLDSTRLAVVITHC